MKNIKTIYLLLLFSCGAPVVDDDNVVDVSSQERPEWIVDYSLICPPLYVCRIGEAKEEASQTLAIQAAQSSAYGQLVKEALPVDINATFELKEGIDSSGNEFFMSKNFIKEKISGRLSGAKTLKSFWYSKMKYNVKGQRKVFNAWVLLSIKKDILDRAWGEEKERAKKVSLNTQKIILDLDLNKDSSEKILSVFNLSQKNILDIIDTPEKLETIAQIKALEEKISQNFLIHAIELDYLKERFARLKIQALLFGRSMSGLKLEISSECDSKKVKNTISLKNESESIYFLPRKSALKECLIDVCIPGKINICKLIKVKPWFSHVYFTVNSSIPGYPSGFIQKELASNLQESLIKHHDNDFVNVAEIKIFLGGTFTQPHHVSRRLFGITGNIKFLIKLPNGNLLLRTKESVKGIGSNTQQINDAIKNNLIKLITEKVSTVIEQL